MDTTPALSAQKEFLYSQTKVTTLLINGMPWFVAKDVGDILGLTNVRMSLQNLDEDEKLTSLLLTSGQNRKTWFINESGLYNLIFQSRKPEAKTFRKWVTSEVLPAIRQTGSYGTPQPNTLPGLPPKETIFTGARVLQVGYRTQARTFYTFNECMKNMGKTKSIKSRLFYWKANFPDDFITIDGRAYASEKMLLRIYDDLEASIRRKQLTAA